MVRVYRVHVYKVHVCEVQVYEVQVYKVRVYEVSSGGLPGCDQREDQHLQHPHQQLSREGEVDLSLEIR